jgi:hypothetical protein
MTTKSRPMLFSGPMVRAILDGHKWQTRRALKPRASKVYDFLDKSTQYNNCKIISPYGQPGDQLWVRETWAMINGQYVYAASAPRDIVDGKPAPVIGGWKPSIHMPRVASRITLEVTGMRIERLNNVSEDDALAEGIVRFSVAGQSAYGLADSGNPILPRAALAYRDLWEKINGLGSWAANPWVWVIEFKRI